MVVMWSDMIVKKKRKKRKNLSMEIGCSSGGACEQIFKDFCFKMSLIMYSFIFKLPQCFPYTTYV